LDGDSEFLSLFFCFRYVLII